MSTMIDYLLLRHAESIYFVPKLSSTPKVSLLELIRKQGAKVWMRIKKRFQRKSLEKFIVLIVWIAIYVGLYFITKSSPVAHQMKAHSIDRMGLLPSTETRIEAINPQKFKGGKNVH